MPIDHFGLGVPDVRAAQTYYDELMPKVGFQPCFGNGYCPVDWNGAQLFLYESKEETSYSRFRPGFHHVAFVVSTRDEVDAVTHGCRVAAMRCCARRKCSCSSGRTTTRRIFLTRMDSDLKSSALLHSRQRVS